MAAPPPANCSSSSPLSAALRPIQTTIPVAPSRGHQPVSKIQGAAGSVEEATAAGVRTGLYFLSSTGQYSAIYLRLTTALQYIFLSSPTQCFHSPLSQIVPHYVPPPLVSSCNLSPYTLRTPYHRHLGSPASRKWWADCSDSSRRAPQDRSSSIQLDFRYFYLECSGSWSLRGRGEIVSSFVQLRESSHPCSRRASENLRRVGLSS